MCIPAAIFEYEEEMELLKEKDDTVKNYCYYSGLPSPLHYQNVKTKKEKI
tara:strand:- start:684 stop:833 length:150 start_codon:yes stop_codon:yes gene_type:complete